MKKTHRDHIPFTDMEERIARRIIEQRSRAAVKFPLVFGIATSFGIVATYYGFEKLMDRIDLFTEQPWMLLVVGITTLLITGAAYSKLN